jgi:DNA-binding MarR family transcriptional regulator
MPIDRFQAPDDGDLKTLNKLYRVIEEFRKEQPAMPTSYISAFLQVAMKPGEGPTDYAKALGTIQPVMSRYLSEIGIKAREREEPLHWVDREEDLQNLRKKRFFLTAKGRGLMHRIIKILEE